MGYTSESNVLTATTFDLHAGKSVIVAANAFKGYAGVNWFGLKW